MPRPKGSGASFIRIEAGDEAHRPRIFIGRALWQAIGSPSRLEVQRVGGVLIFRAAHGDHGYTVAASANGMPRLTVGQPLLETLRIEEGKYPAEIKAGAIIV